MKLKDVKVGEEYACSRSTHKEPQRVKVLEVGVRFEELRSADHRGGVVWREFVGCRVEGLKASPIEHRDCVEARYLLRTWAEHEIVSAERVEAQHKKEREERRAIELVKRFATQAEERGWEFDGWDPDCEADEILLGGDLLESVVEALEKGLASPGPVRKS